MFHKNARSPRRPWHTTVDEVFPQKALTGACCLARFRMFFSCSDRPASRASSCTRRQGRRHCSMRRGVSFVFPGISAAAAACRRIWMATRASPLPTRFTMPLCTVQWASFSSPKTQGRPALFFGAVFTCPSLDLYDSSTGRQCWTGILLPDRPFSYYKAITGFGEGRLGRRAGWDLGMGRAESQTCPPLAGFHPLSRRGPQKSTQPLPRVGRMDCGLSKSPIWRMEKSYGRHDISWFWIVPKPKTF